MFVETSITIFTCREFIAFPVRRMVYSSMLYHFTKTLKCFLTCEACNSVNILYMTFQSPFIICLVTTIIAVPLLWLPSLPVFWELLSVLSRLCCNPASCSFLDWGLQLWDSLLSRLISLIFPPHHCLRQQVFDQENLQLPCVHFVNGYI